MKKASILLVLLTVISVGIWLGRNGLPMDSESLTGDDSATITDSAVQNPVPEEVLTDKDPAEEAEALQLVSRPLPAGASELAIQKINESIDSIKSNYNYINPWLDLAAYRKISGDNQGAIAAWNFVIKIRPTDSVAYHNLGDMHAFTLKDYSKGEEYFLSSIARNPQNVDAYIQVASIYEYHLKFKLAQTEPLLLNGINANPDDINLKIALANYYRNVGNIGLARVYLEKALELSPGNTKIKEELDSLGN